MRVVQKEIGRVRPQGRLHRSHGPSWHRNPRSRSSAVRALHQHHHRPFRGITQGQHQTETAGNDIAACRFSISLSRRPALMHPVHKLMCPPAAGIPASGPGRCHFPAISARAGAGCMAAAGHTARVHARIALARNRPRAPHTYCDFPLPEGQSSVRIGRPLSAVQLPWHRSPMQVMARTVRWPVGLSPRSGLALGRAV